MKLLLKSVFFVLALACSGVGAGELPKLQQVSEHVWSYVWNYPMTPANSYGANAGIVVGSNAVLVVDTLISAREGKRLLADIRAVTKLPIKYVANTHYHLDHAWGNSIFTAEGAAVIGTTASAKLMAERGAYGLAHADQFGLTPEDLAGTTLAPATLGVAGLLSIDLGGVTVELRSLAPGHCPDNLVAYVPQDKVVFCGDLLFTGCHPYMGESDIAGWLSGLDAVNALGAEKLVPGHGAMGTAKDVAEMKEYLKAFDEKAQALTKGKTQADAPAIATELLKSLPEQGRKELSMMAESNLRMKYLQK